MLSCVYETSRGIWCGAVYHSVDSLSAWLSKLSISKLTTLQRKMSYLPYTVVELRRSDILRCFKVVLNPILQQLTSNDSDLQAGIVSLREEPHNWYLSPLTSLPELLFKLNTVIAAYKEFFLDFVKMIARGLRKPMNYFLCSWDYCTILFFDRRCSDLYVSGEV